MNDLSESAIFNKGDKMPEPYNRYFVGQAYLQMLVTGEKEFNCPIGNVTFEPGCRNNWHRHPGGEKFCPNRQKHDICLAWTPSP